jgi:hypothetical protein
MVEPAARVGQLDRRLQLELRHARRDREQRGGCGEHTGPSRSASDSRSIHAASVDDGDADRRGLVNCHVCAMKKTIWALVGIAASVFAQAQSVDWQKVDDALGRKAAVSGDVHRYGFARSDLAVKLDGVTIKPALALGGWVAFKPMQDGVIAMGDLVLLEQEIHPVMLKMISGGLEITAIHNHLLRASPATLYMHIAGRGDAIKIANALRDALAESKTPLSVPPSSPTQPAIDLQTAQLDRIIGSKGQVNGGVYQVSVARRDPVFDAGMALTPPAPLGVATGINFQPTGGGKAAVTGDFALSGDEVEPVVNALRTSGIEVTALHSHMLTERPRLFFMHFWAVDDATKLARALRDALDKTASEHN